MSQQILLDDTVFNELLSSNEIKKEFVQISQKSRYQRRHTIWSRYYGSDILSFEDNIKSLKKFERKLTKNIYIGLLVGDNRIKSFNPLKIKIRENKLYVEENIEQGELDYANKI